MSLSAPELAHCTFALDPDIHLEPAPPAAAAKRRQRVTRAAPWLHITHVSGFLIRAHMQHNCGTIRPTKGEINAARVTIEEEKERVPPSAHAVLIMSRYVPGVARIFPPL